MKRLTLAYSYSPALDISLDEYLVSEKYDGVRAYFDGKKLWSRQGKEIKAPQWWLDKLPAVQLDGELWMGRGRFHEVSACVRRTKNIDAEAWGRVWFIAFDRPDVAGDYDVRLKALDGFESSFYRVAGVASPKTKEELSDLFEETIEHGGEGLMIRKIKDGGYVEGRTHTLLKYKP